MIYLTSDINGLLDVYLYSSYSQLLTDPLTLEDILLVYDDNGFILKHLMSHDSQLKQINKATVAFISNTAPSSSWKKKTWHGGEVYEIAPRILGLENNETYDFNNHVLFSDVGYKSHRDYFLMHKTYPQGFTHWMGNHWHLDHTCHYKVVKLYDKITMIAIEH